MTMSWASLLHLLTVTAVFILVGGSAVWLVYAAVLLYGIIGYAIATAVVSFLLIWSGSIKNYLSLEDSSILPKTSLPAPGHPETNQSYRLSLYRLCPHCSNCLVSGGMEVHSYRLIWDDRNGARHSSTSSQARFVDRLVRHMLLGILHRQEASRN